jgi:hypothetical protein
VPGRKQPRRGGSFDTKEGPKQGGENGEATGTYQQDSYVQQSHHQPGRRIHMLKAKTVKFSETNVHSYQKSHHAQSSTIVMDVGHQHEEVVSNNDNACMQY